MHNAGYSKSRLALLSALVLRDKKLARQLTEWSAPLLASTSEPDEAQSAELREALRLFHSLERWTEIQLASANRRADKSSTSAQSSKQSSSELTSPGRKVKIFCDGVFDLMHFGHFNALRQAAQLGDELYVGVCSDEEVVRAKGVYPLFSAEERAAVVRACKWVTKVVVNTPYTIDLAYLESTGCDFTAHGDDIALNADGVDCYAEIRAAGRLKIFRRTRGVSTTTLVSRLLAVIDSVHPEHSCRWENPVTATSLLSYPHNGVVNDKEFSSSYDEDVKNEELSVDPSEYMGDSSPTMSQTQQVFSKITKPKNPSLFSTRRLEQFIGHPRKKPAGARTVYVDGSFDILHSSHAALFDRAKEKGDWLIVGVQDDLTVRSQKGPGYPIQTMLERALCVLAMQQVDEVILGVPFEPTPFLLSSFNIDLVLKGASYDPSQVEQASFYTDCPVESIPDAKVRLHCFPNRESVQLLTTNDIIQRIHNNRAKLNASIAMRTQRENRFEEEDLDRDRGLS